MLLLCLDLAKNDSHKFLLSVFKWMLLFILKITVLSLFHGYQTKNLYSKSIIMVVLFLVLTNSLFTKNCTRLFKGKLVH